MQGKLLNTTQHKQENIMYQDSDHEPCLPRQYGDPVSAQLIDEENDTRTLEILEILGDPAQLHAFDNRHDLNCLVDDVILDWDQNGRPALPGHDEITPSVIDQAISDFEEGKAYSAESYLLCAAICEATDSTASREIKETPAYNALFEAVKTVVEMQQ
jgi:hypothetical protein